MNGNPMNGSKVDNIMNVLSSAMVADALRELGYTGYRFDGNIKPAVPYSRLIGRAITWKVVPDARPWSGQIRYFEEAIESGKNVWNPVMVVETPTTEGAIWGEGATRAALRYGFVGAVIDGAQRDTVEVKELRFPVFSKSITPCTIDFIAGEGYNVPLRIGGTEVKPGDLVIGDNDGIVFIPEGLEEKVFEIVKKIRDMEAEVFKGYDQGLSYSEAIKAIQGLF